MTPEELHKVAETELEAQKQIEHTLCVCTAAGCISTQSDKVKEALEKEIEKHGLKEKCKVKGVGCMGLCMAGPLVSVEKTGTLYQLVKAEDAATIVESLGKPSIKRLECDTKQPFFARQKKIVL